MIQNPMLFYWTNVQHGKIIWPHYLKSQTLFTYNLVSCSFLLGLFHIKYINIYFKLLNYYFLYLIFVNTWLIIIIAGPLLTTLTETWAFVFVCVSHWIGALYQCPLFSLKSEKDKTLVNVCLVKTIILTELTQLWSIQNMARSSVSETWPWSNSATFWLF